MRILVCIIVGLAMLNWGMTGSLEKAVIFGFEAALFLALVCSLELASKVANKWLKW